MSLERKMKRDKTGPQAQVRILSLQFESPNVDMTVFKGRDGGTHDLHVGSYKPGVYTSTWMINREAKKLLRDMGGKAVITLVVDTNTGGHPMVSMKMQQIFIRPDHPEDKDDNAPLYGEFKKN